ncbi:hypothetical protein niasHT_011571 [Heterodera trifolii]|uniref:DWNN domain-containing protein n=1 Tax=Heterodera trifolii TaxID=157864 RepID=A0ABD2L7I9_9BILA
MTFSSSVVFLLPVQLLLVVIGAVFIILSQCCGGGSQKKKTKAGAAVPAPQTSAAGGPPGAAEAPSSVKSPEKCSGGTNKVPPSKTSSHKFSVHYKFKATQEYKMLTFDGLHIGVDELKKAIATRRTSGRNRLTCF